MYQWNVSESKINGREKEVIKIQIKYFKNRESEGNIFERVFTVW